MCLSGICEANPTPGTDCLLSGWWGGWVWVGERSCMLAVYKHCYKDNVQKQSSKHTRMIQTNTCTKDLWKSELQKPQTYVASEVDDWTFLDQRPEIIHFDSCKYACGLLCLSSCISNIWLKIIEVSIFSLIVSFVCQDYINWVFLNSTCEFDGSMCAIHP